MRAVDPRLLEYAHSTRRFLWISIGIGVATAALVIAQAFLLAHVIVAGFQDGASLESQRGRLMALGFVIVARGVLAWASDRAAHSAAAQAKSDLRMAVLEHAMRLGPVWLSGTRSGELTALCTRGIDSLDAYFARYLPQLVLAVLVPVAVAVAILTQDPLSALLVMLTVPMIPVFMVVIGSFTKRQVDRQWHALATLSGHFLDVVAGLPTLKVFGRAKAQAVAIADVGDRYRRSTMEVLRISFLSALALEFVATLSVALVAVAIGLRLVYGEMTLLAGLTALLLAPEAYLPLRLVGQHYHAAAEGVGAANQVFAVLEEPPVGGSSTQVPTLAESLIRFESVALAYPGSTSPVVVDVGLDIVPGTVTALVGPSGAGKSTVLAALMYFLPPTGGAISIRPLEGPVVELADLDPVAWRRQISYLPQSPYLGAGTLFDAVRLGTPAASDEAVLQALAEAGLDLAAPATAAVLPDGPMTMLGEDGVGLSAGQLRRVALARVLLQDRPLVLLDEPTAALDPNSEDAVVEAVRALRSRGRTVVLVAHRPALAALADTVVRVDPAAPALEPVLDVTLESEAAAAAVVTAPPWTERA